MYFKLSILTVAADLSPGLCRLLCRVGYTTVWVCLKLSTFTDAACSIYGLCRLLHGGGCIIEWVQGKVWVYFKPSTLTGAIWALAVVVAGCNYVVTDQTRQSDDCPHRRLDLAVICLELLPQQQKKIRRARRI